jgi:hypothetical protein
VSCSSAIRCPCSSPRSAEAGGGHLGEHQPIAAAAAVLYFRWPGPSRQRFSACDSWEEHRAQLRGR